MQQGVAFGRAQSMEWDITIFSDSTMPSSVVGNLPKRCEVQLDPLPQGDARDQRGGSQRPESSPLHAGA